MKVNNPLKLQGRKKLEERYNGTIYYRISFPKQIKEHNQRYEDYARLHWNFYKNHLEIVYD